ncbi:protealysin inhibitor emfourin [Paraburkholderia phymatum]|uniref:protealysin inhibitor emfourin n=1 Tax=Paraburkholderia phymatum TaxID=148447 RepID=UPI003172A4BE
MQAELTTDGGFGAFPGLMRPVLLDENDLPPDERAMFERLVAEARAEAAAIPPRTAKPVPDGRTYRIDVHSDDMLRLSAADPSVPPAFAALMDFVKKHGHR